MTRYVLVGTPFSTFTRSVALALHAKEQDFEQASDDKKMSTCAD